MTTGEAEQVMSPSSDWILHESYRDALRIIRCQMLSFTLKGTTLFLGWCWHWREPVVTAVPISIFPMGDLFLVISILAKTSCRVRKVETCRRGKGRKNLTAVSSKWIGFLCVGMRARFAKDLRRALHLCSKLWPPQRSVALLLSPECTRHPVQRMSILLRLLATAVMYGKER